METGAEQIWSQILVVCFTFVQQHIRSNDPFMSFFNLWGCSAGRHRVGGAYEAGVWWTQDIFDVC
ncbi:MAG: hypothetical protein CL920_10105 [Deltaproteobacteria bacterium]|nr:hypothetical protein [Deltaproteobacteria bacterium]